MARLAFYPDAPKPPCVVGYEVSGTVAVVGEGVESRFSVGDRVAAPVRARRQRAAPRAGAVTASGDLVALAHAASIRASWPPDAIFVRELG
jgi:NADPH:quinone reductase-like Zn-dependent oxidoreductase